MTERMAWRGTVARSRLPAAVRLTLLSHSQRGHGHWHDEQNNEHAYPRARLAQSVGADESTIRRHYRRAEAEGYLVMHERGHRGQREGQGRGHQNVFHYVTPDDPWPCGNCGKGGRKGGKSEPAASAAQVPKGGSNYPLSGSLSGNRDASSTESTTQRPPRSFSTHAEVVAAITHLSTYRETAHDISAPATSFRRQPPTATPFAAAGPTSSLATETADRPTSTSGDQAADWFYAASDVEEAAARRLDADQLTEAEVWTVDAEVSA